MKKEIADQWVEALRSGKYKQTTDKLKRNDKYCCLGVLCEISNISEFSKEEEYLASDIHIPKKVRSWARLKHENGWIPGGEEALTDLNDCGSRDSPGPLTFDEIADVIQMTWEEL